MCVIVHQPVGAYLDKETAQNMWNRNPDGGGFAYINDDGEFTVEKAMNFDYFWRTFETHRAANRDKEFLIHFRIATSGKIGLDNTHPFEIDDETLMAHNGMLNHIVGKISLYDEVSDTRAFIRDILPMLPDGWLDNPVLVDMVEDYIGGSKLMFLTKSPDLEKTVYILNEHLGDEVNGMWMSNTYHYPAPKKISGYQWQSASVDEEKTASKVVTELFPKKEPVETKALPYRSTAEADRKRIEEFWLGTALEDVNNYNVLPEDTDWELEALLSLREASGLSTEVSFNPLAELYECEVCYESISPVNGDCGCWELVCIACGSMAPYCVHDAEDRELHLVTEAYKAYEDKTNGNRREQLEAPF